MNISKYSLSSDQEVWKKTYFFKSGESYTIFHYKSSFLNLSYSPASLLQYRSYLSWVTSLLLSLLIDLFLLPFLPPLTFIYFYAFSCWWTFELILVCFLSMTCNDATNILVFFLVPEYMHFFVVYTQLLDYLITGYVLVYF